MRNIMSLIIAYIGKKGCVMAADKRKIGYFGDKKNLGKKFLIKHLN